MFKKDGIIYESEEEYMMKKPFAEDEPKRQSFIWPLLAAVCLLIVLFFVITVCSEGQPPV